MKKKIILLKLTGTIFIDQKTKLFTRNFIDSIVDQIKQLFDRYQFSIVIGGGNLFRGAQDNGDLQLRPAVAHTIGMIGTTMNGLVLYDLLQQKNVPSTLLCAFDCPLAGEPISQEKIDNAHAENKVIIFSGGTGNPYISTDTNAAIRARQIGALELWKATNVDGIYNVDPNKDPNAIIIAEQTYQDALKNNTHIMDQAALIIAQEGKITTRVFNAFNKNALLNASNNVNFGSKMIH